ncbi:MAG: transposase [Deltaproteobacteria bacterium]|nr:MAG: transposase [Deltaproteobacteria bacterium]
MAARENYTAAQIARALGITKRSANRRAKEEKWPFVEENGNGGKEKRFYSLPAEVRRALHAWEIRCAGETPTPLDTGPTERGGSLQGWLEVGETERAVALARLAVLRVQADWVGKNNGKRGHHLTVLKEFYGRLNTILRNAGKNARTTTGLLELGFREHEIPEVLLRIKKVSVQTAYRWQAALKESREQGAGSGVVGLVRRYNWDEDEERRQEKESRRGLGLRTMTPEMVSFVRLLLVKGQKDGGIQLFPSRNRLDNGPIVICNRALLFRRLSENFPAVPHPAHFNRWVNHYLLQEGEGLAAICLPSWWRANCQPKGGCAGEKADYFGQMWELDGTPADVMLKDGRHEILAGVDIFSRDALLEVEKHATSLTVAKLFHQGIINWGVPERIITDRGTIFKSQQIVTACAQLGIDLHLCEAYAPDQKPHVEAFFGSLARMLFEALPWYIGHNPGQRKLIEEYHKFYRVFYHRRGEKISCEATAAELREVLGHWLAKVYRAEPHRFADAKLGRSVFVWERQANSPRRAPAMEAPEHLDALLAPAISRTFNSGVTWENAEYLPDSADAWQAAQRFARQKVMFKPDLADISRGTLWEKRADGTAGKFICRLDSSLMNKEKLEEYLKAKKSIIKAHKRRRKAAEALTGPQGYDRELARMPFPKVAVAGFGQPVYDGEAYRALKNHDDRFGLKLVADQVRDEKIAQEAAALADGQRQREQSLTELKETPEVRRYVEIITALAKGEAISDDDRQFLRFFELEDTYRALLEWFKEIKMRAAMERWDG